MIATIKGVTTTTLTLSVKKLLGRPNAIAPLAMPVIEVSQHLARCGHKGTPKLFSVHGCTTTILLVNKKDNCSRLEYKRFGAMLRVCTSTNGFNRDALTKHNCIET